MHKALMLAAITSVATALGGFLAVKVRDRTHIILGLAAGLMLGLVFFDLLPTVFEENATHFGGVRSVGLAIVLGFLILHFSERWFATHEPFDSHHDNEHQHHAGRLAALAMASTAFAFISSATTISIFTLGRKSTVYSLPR